MSRTLRACAALVAAGLALRAALLFAAPELRLTTDETGYVYLGLFWQRFGVLPDLVEFLVPPLYPALLATSIGAAGAEGLWFVKAFQVAVSAIAGAGVGALAYRIYGERAAIVATALWAFHLPAAATAHTLRPETIFVSLVVAAVGLAVVAIDDPDADPKSWLCLGASGSLLGFAVLFKPGALPLVFGGALWLAVQRRQGSRIERTLRVGVLVLSVTAVVLPWTLRNLDLYGTLAIGGASLGHDLHRSVNAEYQNAEYEKRDIRFDELYADDPEFLARFIEDPALGPWESSRAPTFAARQAENIERSIAFAKAHPAFVARTRIKKLADWATPLSDYVSTLARGFYDTTSLGTGALRPASVILALASTVLVLVGGFAGLVLAPVTVHHRRLLFGVILCLACTAPLVAMSRARLPVEPFLMIGAAGWLTARDGQPTASSIRTAVACAVVASLAALWALNAREIAWVIDRALG